MTNCRLLDLILIIMGWSSSHMWNICSSFEDLNLAVSTVTFIMLLPINLASLIAWPVSSNHGRGSEQLKSWVRDLVLLHWLDYRVSFPKSECKSKHLVAFKKRSTSAPFISCITELMSHRPKLDYLNLRLKAKFNQLRFEAQVSIQYI